MPISERDRFKFAWIWFLYHEGGRADRPNDDGGLTKYGFSEKHHPDLDIEKLTPDRASRECHDRYWTRYRINEIEHPIIAAKVLDLCMWMGPGDAGRYLQLAVNAAAGRQVLDVDGAIGSQTIGAVRSVEPSAVLIHLRQMTAIHIRRQGREDPTEAEFTLGGWWDRAYA